MTTFEDAHGTTSWSDGLVVSYKYWELAKDDK